MKACWLSIAIVLVACGNGGGKPKPKPKTPEEVKTDWGSKVQAKLDKVVAAAKAADAAELGAPGDGKLDLDFDYHDDKSHPNAIAVQNDDALSASAARPQPPKQPTQEEKINAALEKGEVPDMTPQVQHPARFTFQDDWDSHVFRAKALLGIEGGPPSDRVIGEYPENRYDQLVSAKYLLVVTPSDVTWPEVSGGTFKSGHAKLRAVLVDIDAAKPLGGFETEVVNSDSVLVKDLTDAKGMQPKLDRDFLSEAGAAVRKGIETRWPGAKTPIDFGMRTW